ncbi:MAG: type II 3-dehydroquinate dehydratase [Candidatus Dormibacteria bacterium]
MTMIGILNGPNLNRLGRREPEVYGTTTLAEVVDMVRAHAAEVGWEVEDFQSNHEGALIDEIHRLADDGAVGLVLNAGALTHYSYALHDAIAAVDVPTVEVHISDITRREEWRRRSVLTDACVGFIAGHGVKGYLEAVDLLRQHLGRGNAPELRVMS